MAESLAKMKSVALPVWLLLPLAILTAAAAVGGVALQQRYLSLTPMQASAAIAGIAGIAVLLFGPSRLILTTVFLLALLDHQFRSFAILPFAGVEWHPRELLLLLLLAHGAVKLWQRRLSIRWTPMHFGMLLYTAVFAYMAFRGLWLDHAPRDIIAECRAPLFLLSFWVFAGAIRDARELLYFGNLALCVIVLLATATLAAFGYFALAGPIANTQNAMGEFVPRVLAGIPVQSIRPSGHAWLESSFVVCLGMLLCPREPWYRRALYIGLVPLFAGAIAAGMMRTALVSVCVSVLVLFWLNLPRVGRGLALSLALGVLAVAAYVAVLQSWESLGEAISGDRSLTARTVESQGALSAAWEHPIFGAGLGASFVALDLAQPDSTSSAIQSEYHSLHNVWLYFLWKGGVLGLGLVLLALGGMLLYSQHIVNRLPSMSQRCLGRALQAALIGQLVASATMARLTFPNGGLYVGFWALSFVLLEAYSRDNSDTTLEVMKNRPETQEKREESSPFVEPEIQEYLSLHRAGPLG